jgi:NADPH:quinone reductase-like Zn-dependent oxidoreductase
MSDVMPDIPDAMQGVVLLGHGGPDMLEYRHDLPVPRPQTGDVLIKIHAAGVNNTDINTRLAWYSKSDAADEDASWAGAPLNFPLIQGIDACGEIVAVGDGVSQSRIGERVLVEPCLYESGGKTLDQPWFFGSECNGAFAEYSVVAARHAHAITSGPDLSRACLLSLFLFNRRKYADPRQRQSWKYGSCYWRIGRCRIGRSATGQGTRG